MNSANASILTSAAGGKMRVALSFSSGIRAIRHVASFLDVDAVVTPGRGARTDADVVAVVVWGRKQNARKALNYAQRHSLPVWYLEDGFIRSCESNAHSRKSYSLIVDKSGVYYDSTTACDVESLLNLPDDQFDEQCNDQVLQEAAECRQLLVQHGITKYNYCKKPSPERLKGPSASALVLVIDQTLHDASVAYGGMSQVLFERMLDAAISENPGARIVVRTHPDVVAGKRGGYLLEYARQRGTEISADADNPMPWLARASRVYVGTSQLGYEALLCGCEVTTFGQPFYAGWGLTDDRNPVQRRVRRRSIEQLFFASHIALTQYRDPIDAGFWTLRQCLEHVMEQKVQFARNAHSFHCVGISPWKRQYLARYLRSPDGSVRFGSDTAKVEAGQKALTWSFRHWATQDNVQPVRVEDGFMRSRGLGSDFYAPSSLVVDMQGIYFDRHRLSDLEHLLNDAPCTDQQRTRACALREMIVNAELSKYNMPADRLVATDQRVMKAAGKSISLIIGQVEDDESIRRGCAGINTNSGLCQAVRVRRPDDYLIYKPHPDVESGNRRGAVSHQVIADCIDEVATSVAITHILAQSDECHTMTSLTGFEALMRGKRVATYGMPFYAGWGLTEDALKCARRTQFRTLDELVYFTLIAYPRYLHVESGEFITPETLVNYLARQQRQPPATNHTPRWFTKLDNIVKSLRYAA